MKISTRLMWSSLTIAIFLATASICMAQDPELVRHFDYDRSAPLGVKRIGVQRRGHATIYDITYTSPKGGEVPAYLVVPKGRGPFAAVLWGHWCWGNSSMRNRKQFLEEALVMARAGVVSILPDAPIARPGHVEIKDPLDDRGPADFLQQVVDNRRGLDVLLARRDVDRKRVAYVGHSCNGAAGAILSGLDRRPKAFVLMAATMSDELTQDTKEYRDFRQKVGAEKMDAFIARYAYLDQGKFVSHAAPAVVFLQFANHESFLTPERARQHAAVVSDPKQIKFYEAPHSLNAEARRDRIHFLVDQLKLRPISDAEVVSIPNLYQPPAPN